MQQSLVETYEISKRWRVGIAVVSGIYMSFGVFLISCPFIRPMSPQAFAFIFFAGLGTASILFFLFIVIYTFTYKLEIWTDRIRSASVFSSKEMRLEEIEGYRILRQATNGNTLFFVSEKTKRKIRVFLAFENIAEFKKWLEAHFENLTAIESEKELAGAMGDERLGINEEERKKNLKKLR